MATVVLTGVGVVGIAFLVWFFFALCADQRGRAKCVITVKAREGVSVTERGWRVHSFARVRGKTGVPAGQPAVERASVVAKEKRSASFQA
jgi:hypothetical protein